MAVYKQVCKSKKPFSISVYRKRFFYSSRLYPKAGFIHCTDTFNDLFVKVIIIIYSLCYTGNYYSTIISLFFHYFSLFDLFILLKYAKNRRLSAGFLLRIN